jgi:hypothetical protein
MTAYNIYYNGKKLNSKPLSKTVIDTIKKNGTFAKQTATGIEKYNLSNIKIYKTTVV